jgi:hypothetical protein
MQTSAIEEAALTEHSNEPELQPEIQEPAPTAQEEAPKQETTSLVPTEPEVIEGEVVVIEPPETTEDYPSPKHTPYWLLVPFTILLCLLILAGSYLVPLVTPTATITVIPVERNITITTAIRAHGRLLPVLTLSQSATAPATGIRHQSATRAHGTITLYNGQFRRQTIAAGTIFTGASGVSIITDQTARIPAGNPPVYGQTSVPAHALSAGASGNIQTYDINTACCLPSVLAKNTQAFIGGAEARDYVVVTNTDIASAQASIQTTLAASEQAALTAQLRPGEEFITTACNNQIVTNHKPGEEAREVTVTLSDTCGGLAYAAHEVYAQATQMITIEAANQLGTGYALSGDLQAHILHATISNPIQGIATFAVKLSAIYVYRLSPNEKQQLLHLIAGKTNQQAGTMLLQFPGIAGAQIKVKGGNRTLPQDIRNIQMIIVYRSVSM